MVKAVAAVAAVLGFLLIPQAHSASISGIGSRSCSSFSSDLVRSNGAQWEDTYYAWAQGWMSRLNVDRQVTGNSHITNGQIAAPGLEVGPPQKSYLRSFCYSNPSALYAEAATALYLAVLQRLGGSV